MPENTIVRKFNRSNIEQRVADGYINLNQMALATGRRIDNWLRLQETTSLLREFTSDPQYADFEPLIAIEGRSGGTWAHPDIAIQFAQWCSPAFALQVSRWVREWMTTGRSPLADIDRVGLRDTLKDGSRLRMTDRVKVYLDDIRRYDDKNYRSRFFASVHDSINQAVTGETAGQMRDRLAAILGRPVKQNELIRDYFPSIALQHYISLCETSANLMLRDGVHPLTAVEQSAELVLPAGYRPTPINFVEHINFVRQRLEAGQGGFELPGT